MSALTAHRGPGGDAGVTLVEVVVSMTIMSIFMAIFTSAAVQMFHYETDTETATSAKTQIHLAFLRLDRDIRYASAISVPNSSYVEYLRTDQPDPTCTELWLDPAARQLKSRTWVRGTTPGSTWTSIVSGVSATQPFTLVAPVAPVTTQRLRVNLVVAPSGDTGPSRVMDLTFTATNSTSSTESGAVCTEERPSS
jgi:prepilin-type N-terminal cleavage/methylation domain-containing protein